MSPARKKKAVLKSAETNKADRDKAKKANKEVAAANGKDDHQFKDTKYKIVKVYKMQNGSNRRKIFFYIKY